MIAATADQGLSDDNRLLLSVLAALVLHVAIAVCLIYRWPHSPQVVTPQLAIKGVMIDNTAKRLQRERAEAERVAREQAEAEQRARDEAEAEQQRVEQAEQEAKRQAEETAERQRQQVAEQQQVKERERQAAAQKVAAQKAAAQKAAAEKKRLADIKAKQAAQQKKEREAREQAAREAELKRQLADEEGLMQAENAGLLSQYAALIEQRVVRNWNKPATARPGIQCEVKVTQASGGTVLSVELGRCNGDSAVRQSIEAAVYKSSPLPPPPDPRLFARAITFIFKPTE